MLAGIVVRGPGDQAGTRMICKGSRVSSAVLMCPPIRRSARPPYPSWPLGSPVRAAGPRQRPARPLRSVEPVQDQRRRFYHLAPRWAVCRRLRRGNSWPASAVSGNTSTWRAMTDYPATNRHRSARARPPTASASTYVTSATRRGLARRRSGKEFSYVGTDGERVGDRPTLARTGKGLARIPPASEAIVLDLPPARRSHPGGGL